MTFERIAPQVVRHSEGYLVQIADRWHLAYVDRVWSGPDSTDNRAHEGRCHGMLLVDGKRGTVVREVEIGD